MIHSLALNPDQKRRAVMHELRCLLPRMEGFPDEAQTLPFGLPAIDSHLPQGGLAFGAVHEIAPEASSDLPTAFGFMVGLLGAMPPGRPLLLVMPTRGFGDYGRPHGHGLNGLGLDPARLLLIETTDGKESLWALEEALHSGAPAAVAGWIETLDLKASQRLLLATRESGLPLLLLRPERALEASTAATRWRIGTAEAARDRFGLIRHWRWRLRLQRCRNGRTGEWVVEFDHVAHRFSLAAALADPAVFQRTGAQSG